jgi:predicted nucleic acid-binding protein
MTIVAEPIFLDTNILVYASVDSSPFYTSARAQIDAYEDINTPIWISRQVIREFLATLVRPHLGIPITTITAAARQFEVRFRVAEESPLVTVQLLLLLEEGRSTQVHDTNSVATMQSVGIQHILTNNPDDFQAYAHLITIIPFSSNIVQP